MKNNNEIKKEVKISKLNDDYTSSQKFQKKNSYSKIANKSRVENDISNFEREIDNEIFDYFQKENENVLTPAQIERLNKIKEETQLRSERYSELSNNFNLNKNKNKNKMNISNKKLINLNKDTNNDSSRNLTNNDLIISDNINNDNNDNDYENEINVINPNIDRVFNKVHPFLFIKNEPIILIGSDLYLFIIIFSLTSFLSIIFYSLKEQTMIIMKFIYIFSYLFYTITYILLMILNPGMPNNKSNIDLDELKKNYYQCTLCNSIVYKKNEFITYHCPYCNICVEIYDHHCDFVGKCIGKNNITIFRCWLFSIPCYILVIFMYMII